MCVYFSCVSVFVQQVLKLTFLLMLRYKSPHTHANIYIHTQCFITPRTAHSALTWRRIIYLCIQCFFYLLSRFMCVWKGLEVGAGWPSHTHTYKYIIKYRSAHTVLSCGGHSTCALNFLWINLKKKTIITFSCLVV